MKKQKTITLAIEHELKSDQLSRHYTNFTYDVSNKYQLYNLIMLNTIKTKKTMQIIHRAMMATSFININQIRPLPV
jgi:hypothetical protein